MSRGHQSLLMGLVAVLLLRLSLTGDFLNYVKPVMRPWLIIAGSVLGAVALAHFLAGRRPSDDAGSPLLPPGEVMVDDGSSGAVTTGGGGGGGDHDGHGPPRLAWLLIIPIATVFIVAPGSLGSFAATRGGSWSPQAPDTSGWPPALLSPIEGAHELTLNDFNSRAYFDEAQGLENKRVRLVGFVRSAPSAAPGFLITRFWVSCCAADGLPISVRIVAAGPPPPDDTWVEVEGTWQVNAPDPGWRADEDTNWATLIADTVETIPEPREPYES